MSKARTKTETAAPAAVKESGKDRESLRFTPLRSYATRARALTKEARAELALSPLVAVPRPNG